MLLANSDPDRIRHWLWQSYAAGAPPLDFDWTTSLATMIETWWPAILVALTQEVTNARTEGFNRIIKQAKRVVCGLRNWGH